MSRPRAYREAARNKRRLYLSPSEARLPIDWQEPETLSRHLQEKCLPRDRRNDTNKPGPRAA